MAYKFVPYAPEGSGGKDPVLTELTVTENGVYDEPVINNAPEPIIWDGVTGEIFEAVSDEYSSFFKVSDRAFTASDLIGATIEVYTQDGVGNIPIVAEDVTSFSEYTQSAFGEAVLSQGAVVFMTGTSTGSGGSSSALKIPMMITISEVHPEEAGFGITVGTYFARHMILGEIPLYLKSITFPATSTTPADGWNKVTVNVAGDIIDVPELPTEVDEGKIYRVVKEAKAEILMASNSTSSGVGAYATLADTLTDLTKLPCEIPTHVVDSLPDNMEPVVLGESYGYIPVYVLESTGEPYVNFEGTVMPLVNFGPMGMFVATGLTLGGLIGSVDDIVYPDDGSWAMYILRGQSSTTYGIPDEANNKTVMEHNGSGWVECGSLTGTIPVIDVTELPTEDINENALYRIVSVNAYAYMSNTAVPIVDAYPNSRILVVDVLPETPELPSDGSLVFYVLNDTGYVYATEDGSTYKTIAEAMGVPSTMFPDFGWVENEMAMTQDGTYTIRKDLKYMYHDGMFVCINEAATPQVKFVMNDTGDGYIVNGNANYVGDVTIPSEHDGLPVTSVSSFQTCHKVITITIPDSVTSIDDSAFMRCSALCGVKLSKNVSVIPRRAFYESRIRSLGSNDGVDKFYAITEIGEQAFAESCIEAFPQCPNLVTIGKEAFKDCGMLRYSYIANEDEGSAAAGVSESHLLVPESVKTIGSGAFEHTFFGQVDFCGTPESIDSTAFKDCPHIRTIQVPWAEGAVEGAPWGATNATVYYNRKQST